MRGTGGDPSSIHPREGPRKKIQVFWLDWSGWRSLDSPGRMHAMHLFAAQVLKRMMNPGGQPSVASSCVARLDVLHWRVCCPHRRILHYTVPSLMI